MNAYLPTDWESLHKDMGCYTCRYADVEALGKKACCTFCGKTDIAPHKISRQPQCLAWKSKKKDSPMKPKSQPQEHKRKTGEIVRAIIELEEESSHLRSMFSRVLKLLFEIKETFLNNN